MKKFMIEVDESSPQYEYLKAISHDEQMPIEDVLASIIQQSFEVDCPTSSDDEHEKTAVEICAEYVVSVLKGRAGEPIDGGPPGEFELSGDTLNDVEQVLEVAFWKLNTLSEQVIREFVADHKRELAKSKSLKNRLKLVVDNEADK